MITSTTGTPVRFLQTMLRQIAELDSAIPSVVPDGIYGRDTLASVSAFQRTHGLPVTGVTDLATWDAVVLAYQAGRAEIEAAEMLMPRLNRLQVLAPGEQNLHVLIVQGILTALARLYSDVPLVTCTGVNDDQTQQAVRWAQGVSALPVTGAVDRSTWQALARLYAAAARAGGAGLSSAARHG